MMKLLFDKACNSFPPCTIFQLQLCNNCRDLFWRNSIRNSCNWTYFKCKTITYVDTKTISIILFWLLKAFSYCLFLVFGHVQYHVFNVFNWYFLHGLPREDSWNNNQVGEGKSWMVRYCILNIKQSKWISWNIRYILKMK